MIVKAVEALGGEPWCFSPDVIARMTDFQLWEVYIRPAIERSKKWRTGGTPGAASVPLGERPEADGPPGEPGSAEHRTVCLNAYMSVQGLSRKRAEEQYERQLAAWRKGGS